MTLNEAVKLLPIIEAASKGKIIQVQPHKNLIWYDLNKNAYFNFDSEYYRIKPESSYRPWKQEEVPIGAIIKFKDGSKSMILGTTSNEILFISNSNSVQFYTLFSLLADAMYSLDNSKTWNICGIKE